jgi:hypothetical protein
MQDVSLIYDPRYHTFDSWASLMCELYATQQLESPTSKTDWKLWGNSLKIVLDIEASPATDTFDNWQQWAQELVNTVNPATI